MKNFPHVQRTVCLTYGINYSSEDKALVLQIRQHNNLTNQTAGDTQKQTSILLFQYLLSHFYTL